MLNEAIRVGVITWYPYKVSFYLPAFLWYCILRKKKIEKKEKIVIIQSCNFTLAEESAVNKEKNAEKKEGRRVFIYFFLANIKQLEWCKLTHKFAHSQKKEKKIAPYLNIRNLPFNARKLCSNFVPLMWLRKHSQRVIQKIAQSQRTNMKACGLSALDEKNESKKLYAPAKTYN